jgi:membrane protease YdiL (CAAX protease family)
LITDAEFNILSIGNPSILITAILFGFAHAFFLSESYGVDFRVYPFIRTMVLGLIWDWITIKSRSILLALISHNLGNVGDKLIRMRSVFSE